MYLITPELYDLATDLLVERIGRSDYFSGTVEFEYGDVECRLTVSLIIYRRIERLPEGDRDCIDDVVPVWWEFHTSTEGSEVPNGFSFSEIRDRLRL